MATTNVILEEAYDPNYEWKEEEVIEYAQFLGFDVENDADLLWIAKEVSEHTTNQAKPRKVTNLRCAARIGLEKSNAVGLESM